MSTPLPEMTGDPIRLGDLINRIAGIIGSDNFPTGERAALRRLHPDPDHPPSLGFYRFFYRHIEGHWAGQRHLPNWQTLLAGMAIMYPAHHQPGRHVGQVLAENRYSEARLERLLDAEPDTQRILLLRAARFLAAKGEPIDWCEFARLLFAADDEAREQQRRHIARDFYRHLPKD